MILKRFYNEKLAQASYLIGCPGCGQAVVVDPNRHIHQYLEAAKGEGLRIAAVTETHIHADYLSGSRELASNTGATLYLSDEGDADWKYSYANESNVKLIRHGDSIRVGAIRLDVVKTPGHTPEHICFVLTDEATLDDPLGCFTGDFIFVGDVGRPDLLERAAGIEGTMKVGAKSLFQSLREFKKHFKASLIVWPGHGAGSACGKSLSGVPMSTLGYEAKANWALKTLNESEFVQTVLKGQPDPPAYFKEMKQRNKLGPASLGELPCPLKVQDVSLLKWLDTKAIIVDIRPVAQVAHGSVPGALHIPAGKSFLNWAGWLVPYDVKVHFIAENQEQATEAAIDMALIGLDHVSDWVSPSAISLFEETRGRATVISQVTVRDAVQASHGGEANILDVRAKSEFDHGHIPGSINIPLGHLENRVGELPSNKPLIVHCAGGTRSMIAMSILAKKGIKRARNMPGGFAEYEQSGLPIEREES